MRVITLKSYVSNVKIFT